MFLQGYRNTKNEVGTRSDRPDNDFVWRNVNIKVED